MSTRSVKRATCQALRCPICWDTMRAPVRTACGHHFCEGCIRDAIQVKLECPTCRTPVSSHRSLRAIPGTDHAGTWDCTSCTLSNPLACSRCQACCGRRPIKVLASGLLSRTDESDEGGDDMDETGGQMSRTELDQIDEAIQASLSEVQQHGEENTLPKAQPATFSDLRGHNHELNQPSGQGSALPSNNLPAQSDQKRRLQQEQMWLAGVMGATDGATQPSLTSMQLAVATALLDIDAQSEAALERSDRICGAAGKRGPCQQRGTCIYHNKPAAGSAQEACVNTLAKVVPETKKRPRVSPLLKLCTHPLHLRCGCSFILGRSCQPSTQTAQQTPILYRSFHHMPLSPTPVPQMCIVDL